MPRVGARVVGHAAYVRGTREGAAVECSCGHRTPRDRSLGVACAELVRHLDDAVRGGAEVVDGDDDDGTTGVREPRRPLPPDSGAGAARTVG